MSAGRAFVALWLLLAATYVLALVIATIGWVGGVRAGVRIELADYPPLVTRVDSAGPAWEAGVRAGDHLALVDGIPVSARTWSETGDVAASMTFLKASGQEVAVLLDQESVPGLASVIGFQITGGMYALVGFFVFTRSRHSAQVATFSVFTMVAAIAIAAAPGATAGHPWSRIVQSTALHWLPVVFVIFIAALGSGVKPAPDRGFPRWILLMPAGALLLDAAGAVEFSIAAQIAEATSAADYVFLATGLLLGLGMLLNSYARTESPVLREQTRVIAIGTAIAILPVVLLSAIPQGAGIGFIVDPEITVMATVIIPLAFAYAILRHELMGIRRLVHRGVSYAMISVLVLALYVAALVTIRATGGGEVGTGSPLTVTLLVALLAGVPFLPRVRELAFATVNRVLYRDFVDHRDVVRRVSRQAVETTTVQGLMSSVLSTISDALGLSFATYAERDDDGLRSVATLGESDQEFARLLRTQVLLQDDSSAVARTAATGPREGEYLFAPVSPTASNSGVVGLGPKDTGEPFREDDLQMIQTIAGLVSTAVARLQLLDELSEKNVELVGLNARLVEIEEQERARLSAYLHDEPLQKASYVLAQYRERALGDDLASILSEVVSELRTFSASLSPAVLTDLGLIRAVEWLVSETQERTDFGIDLRCQGLDRELRMPASTELVAYRVVQEALTNCQKHSQATMVWVSLEAGDDEIVVSIEDNGVGSSGTGPKGDEGPGGLGLLGMRQRIESQNGHLTVANRRSRGFSVAARLPLRNEPS